MSIPEDSNDYESDDSSQYNDAETEAETETVTTGTGYASDTSEVNTRYAQPCSTTNRGNLFTFCFILSLQHRNAAINRFAI